MDLLRAILEGLSQLIMAIGSAILTLIQLIVYFLWTNIWTILFWGFIIFIIFGIWGQISNPDKTRAKRGEDLEKYAFAFLNRLEVEPLTNLLFPVEIYSEKLQRIVEKTTTEQDLLFVSKKGIFCFECKSRGKQYTLYGQLYDKEWRVRGEYVEKDVIKSPINQNAGHIRAINEIVPPSFEKHFFNVIYTDSEFDLMHNGILYGDDCHYFKDKNIFLLNTSGYNKFIEIYNQLPDVYSVIDVAELRTLFKGYVATKEELKAHAQRLQHKWNE